MAAKAKERKVLRIGIIQDGKIIQERLIKANETVTVGEAAKNTFVFPKTSLKAAEFTLFKANRGGYDLHFTDKMKGKISSGGAVVSIGKLKNDPSVKRTGGAFVLNLTPQDRGKITVDSVTVLFQFVAPPPVQAVKSIQAMDFRPRLIEDDDPGFFGFLAIWSALAFVLLIWVWNTEPREFTLEDMPDRFTKIVVKPKKEPVEELEIEDPDAEGETPVEEAEPEPAKAKAEKPKNETEEAQRKEDLKKDVLKKSALLAKVIGTTGETSGGVVENMWSDEDQGLGDIDAALADAGGVTSDASKAGPRGGTDDGGEAADIGDLGGVGSGNADAGGSLQVKVVASVDAGSGTMDEDIGDQGKVKAVVTRYSGQLTYCYEKRLKAVPGLEGRIEIGWSLSGGAVSGVYVVSNSTGDSELASCIQSKIKRWKFDSGQDGDVSWPFVFRAKQG